MKIQAQHLHDLQIYVLGANVITRHIRDHEQKANEFRGTRQNRPHQLMITIEHKFLFKGVAYQTPLGKIVPEIRKYLVSPAGYRSAAECH